LLGKSVSNCSVSSVPERLYHIKRAISTSVSLTINLGSNRITKDLTIKWLK
jgi:hypothetical protein